MFTMPTHTSPYHFLILVSSGLLYSIRLFALCLLFFVLPIYDKTLVSNTAQWRCVVDKMKSLYYFLVLSVNQFVFVTHRTFVFEFVDSLLYNAEYIVHL